MHIIFLVLALIHPQTLTFQSQGKTVEALLVVPSGKPKALILYFHRSIEDRTAVSEWGALFAKDGYSVAGYTADQTLDAKDEAEDALKSLIAQKRFASTPIIAMGASMGTVAAAQLFAEDQRVKSLILIVPASPMLCHDVEKAGSRRVFLIQAENDEVAGANAPAIRNCMPESTDLLVLKGASHRFPASEVSPQVLQWLNKTR
jgi:hypothetical protein